MILELFLSILFISLVSFIGLLVLGIKSQRLEQWLEALVAFAIGALLGDVFIHLLPELSENGFSVEFSFAALSGIIVFFVLEKVIHWHHCHHAKHKKLLPRFLYMSIFGDALHNVIDGIILAGAFLAGPVIGFSTTIAVFLHEVPQELGDFGVMLKGGFSAKKALGVNFVTALTAFIGAGIALLFSSIVEGTAPLLIAFAAGSFLYIAGTDLFPELHKHFSAKKAIIQLFFLVLGVGIMALMLLLE